VKNTKPVIYCATNNKSTSTLSIEFGCVEALGGGEKVIEQGNSKVKNKSTRIESKLK
jgi:hypothetical protein